MRSYNQKKLPNPPKVSCDKVNNRNGAEKCDKHLPIQNDAPHEPNQKKPRKTNDIDRGRKCKITSKNRQIKIKMKDASTQCSNLDENRHVVTEETEIQSSNKINRRKKRKKRKRSKKNTQNLEQETTPNGTNATSKLSKIKNAIKNMSDQIEKMSQTLQTSNTNIQDLVRLLAAKQSECDPPAKEVKTLHSELQKETSEDQPKHVQQILKKDCLLIGGQILEHASEVVVEGVDVKVIPEISIDGVVKDLKDTKEGGTVYKHVIIQLGSETCLSTSNIELMGQKMSKLLETAKLIGTEKVTIGSICPTKNADKNQTITEVNFELELLYQMSEDMDYPTTEFVNHSSNFVFSNGEVDSSVFNTKSEDISALNVKGLYRLLSNLSIPYIVSDEGENGWQQVSRSGAKKKLYSDTLKNSKDNSIHEESMTSKKSAIRVQGHKDTLSNFYPCDLYHRGLSFGSSEAVYQYEKALYHGDYSLAESIRQARHAGHAKRMADQYIRDSPDWERESEYIMWNTLNLKADQCSQFRSELLKTGDKELQHTVTDKRWGTGSTSLQTTFNGYNLYGSMLEKLRSKITNNKHPGETYRTHERQPSCDHCGLTGHLKSKCYYKYPIQCYNCYYYGHKQKVCPHNY